MQQSSEAHYDIIVIFSGGGQAPEQEIPPEQVIGDLARLLQIPAPHEAPTIYVLDVDDPTQTTRVEQIVAAVASAIPLVLLPGDRDRVTKIKELLGLLWPRGAADRIMLVELSALAAGARVWLDYPEHQATPLWGRLASGAFKEFSPDDPVYLQRLANLAESIRRQLKSPN